MKGYGDARSAELVLCLHGLGGSGLNFSLTAPRLAENRRVLVPDLLGHGRSPAPPAGVGAVAAQLQMIRGLVDSAPHERVTLIGHSMGGVLAALHASSCRTRRTAWSCWTRPCRATPIGVETCA